MLDYVNSLTVSDKHDFDTQRKEREEELESEEIEKEVEHDKREEDSECEIEELLHQIFNA